jgi:hypothetical protein
MSHETYGWGTSESSSNVPSRFNEAIHDPALQEKLLSVSSNVGKPALRGALEGARIMKYDDEGNGKLRPVGIARAVINPGNALRRGAMGAAKEGRKAVRQEATSFATGKIQNAIESFGTQMSAPGSAIESPRWDGYTSPVSTANMDPWATSSSTDTYTDPWATESAAEAPSYIAEVPAEPKSRGRLLGRKSAPAQEQATYPQAPEHTNSAADWPHDPSAFNRPGGELGASDHFAWPNPNAAPDYGSAALGFNQPPQAPPQSGSPESWRF